MVKTIMVVDDEPDHIYTVRRILKGSSDEYEVIGANSAMDCLELLEKNVIPDLILLDIIMPEMSGWETYNKIKENLSWKNIPIVFLTARKNQVARNAGGFFGEDYITKPFDVTELKKRIDNVLKSTSRK